MLSYICSGQNDKDKYILFGSGFDLYKVIDKGMSPLKYKGPGATFVLGYRNIDEKRIHWFESDFTGGYLYTRNFPDNDENMAFYYTGELDYSYYSRLSNGNPEDKFYLGGSFDSKINFRYNPKLANSFLNYEAFSSLAFSGLYSKTKQQPLREYKLWIFKIIAPEKNINYKIRAKLPLLSFVIRPPYITVSDFLDPNLDYVNDRVNQGKFLSWNKFFRFSTVFERNRILKNGNMISYSYLWDFYKYKVDYNDVVFALHQFKIALHFKTN